MADSLWKIDKNIEQIIEHGYAFDEETGEVLFDSSSLDKLKQDKTEKIENCALYIENLDSLADAIKKEESALSERRKILERKSGRLRGYVLDHLDGKVETPRVKVSTRTSHYVNVFSEDSLPKKYLISKTVSTVDKKAIKEALDSGKTVNGASIGTRTSLVLK